MYAVAFVVVIGGNSVFSGNSTVRGGAIYSNAQVILRDTSRGITTAYRGYRYRLFSTTESLHLRNVRLNRGLIKYTT